MNILSDEFVAAVESVLNQLPEDGKTGITAENVCNTIGVNKKYAPIVRIFVADSSEFESAKKVGIRRVKQLTNYNNISGNWDKSCKGYVIESKYISGETENKSHKLDVKLGLQRLLKYNTDRFLNIVRGETDAIDADVFLQLCAGVMHNDGPKYG